MGKSSGTKVQLKRKKKTPQATSIYKDFSLQYLILSLDFLAL